VVYPRLVRASLHGVEPETLWSTARPLAAMLVVFAAAAALGSRLVAPGWLAWAGGVTLSLGLAAAVAFVTGLAPEARRAVIARARAMVDRRR
jgi:hypothetical protein